MTKKTRGLFAALIALALALGLVPWAAVAARADDPYAGIKNKEVVGFDGKEWYLTDYDADTVTLLAKGCVAASQYSSGGRYVEYVDSEVQDAVDDYYNVQMSSAARGAVDGDVMFLLTTDQAQAIERANRDVMKCGQYDGTDNNGWWLASPGDNGDSAAYVYGGSGYIVRLGYPVLSSLGVRPALKLNLSSVIFESESRTFSLKPQHAHDFTYSAEGATVTATCGEAGCDLPPSVEGGADHVAKLTVVAPALKTYGEEAASTATLDGLEDFKAATGLEVSEADVRYYRATKGDGDTYARGEEIGTVAPTDAGDYLAEVTLPGVKTGEGTIGDVAAAVGYTIARAETTVTENPTAGEITYGQTLADSALSGGAAGVPGDFAWKDPAIAPAVADSEVTEYDVTFTPTDANYAPAGCRVKLKVNKADSKVTKAPEATNPTHDGRAQALVTAGTAEGGTMQYSLDGKSYSEAIPTGTDAKAYDVWYKVAGDANHNDTEAQRVTSTIAKRDEPAPEPEPAVVTEAPKGRSLAYSGKAQALVTAGKAEGGAMRYSLDGKGWSAKVPTATDAGTYTVRYKAAGDASHTDSAAKSVKSTIAKAKLTSIAKVADQAFAGRAVTPKPSVKSGSKALRAGTDFAYGYKGNTKAGTATVTATGKGNYTGTVKTTFKIVAATTTGRAHLQGSGWQLVKSDPDLYGTTGKSLRMEALSLSLSKGFPVKGSIQYRSHLQGKGWEKSWKKDGATSGTIGESRRIEAVQIKLTGDMAKKYDVYYRVHAQNLGWMGWAKNGAKAGTEGMSKRAEAVQVVLVPKGGKAPAATYRGQTRGYAKAYVAK